MVKSSNDNNLLRYRKYGFSKVGYFDYNFTIGNDGYATINMSLSKEMSSQDYSTKRVRLKQEELDLIRSFIRNSILPLKGKIASFEPDIEEPYEDCTISAGGVCTSLYDDGTSELRKKFDALYAFLEMEHPELSGNNIVNKYNEMSAELSRDRNIGAKR